jgi:enoyl-CoA hydratase/carnithine racemase
MNAKNWLIRTDHGDGVSEICLNRAPVNALSPAFLMEFGDLVNDMAADNSVRAIVISSAFKVFSAGLDLKEAQGFDAAQQAAIVRGLNVGFLALFSCPKPTIVAASGAAIAGGLFFVLASDFRVAGPKVQLGLAEVRVGVDFPVGPLEIARDTLSPNVLRRLMLTGQPMNAQDALAAGVIDEISEDVLSDALRVARQMADIPPSAFDSIKRQIRQATIDRITAGMPDGEKMDEPWITDEARAAMKKMLS